MKLTRKAALKERGEIETGAPVSGDVERADGGELTAASRVTIEVDRGRRGDRGDRRGGRGGRGRERRSDEARPMGEPGSAPQSHPEDYEPSR